MARAGIKNKYKKNLEKLIWMIIQKRKQNSDEEDELSQIPTQQPFQGAKAGWGGKEMQSINHRRDQSLRFGFGEPVGSDDVVYGQKKLKANKK